MAANWLAAHGQWQVISGGCVVASQPVLNIMSSANVNSLFWIKSLEASEEGTTQRVLDDLEPFLSKLGVPFQVFTPKTSAEFLSYLSDIESYAQAGARPMIHIDTHGGPDDGICIIGANGDEFVPWNVVCDSLRSINIATGNNLCVVSAACFGFYVVKHNDIHKHVPFYMLVSSSKTLSFKFTEAQTFGFYKCIFEELDFIKGYNEYLASEMELFLCEKLFAVSLSRYFRFKCMGKGGKKRVEDLVTMALQGRIPPTPANLSFLRQAARQHIKPSEALFSKYASTYFIGKSPGFTFSDVIKFVRARA